MPNSSTLLRLAVVLSLPVGGQSFLFNLFGPSNVVIENDGSEQAIPVKFPGNSAATPMVVEVTNDQTTSSVVIENEGTEQAVPVDLPGNSEANPLAVEVTGNSATNPLIVEVANNPTTSNVLVENNGTEQAIPVDLPGNSAANPLVVEVSNNVDVTTPAPTPLTVSFEWDGAGLTIFPSDMTIYDIFFFVKSDTNPPCDFSMNYVIDNTNSRTIKQFSLSVGGSTEVHFGAGILASELRFGTIGGGTCMRYVMAVGYAAA